MSSSDMRVAPAASAGAQRSGGDGPRADRPRRRTFSPEYKLAMVEAYDAASEPGAKGALLRREGLYDTNIIAWRKARDAGALSALSA